MIKAETALKSRLRDSSNTTPNREGDRRRIGEDDDFAELAITVRKREGLNALQIEYGANGDDRRDGSEKRRRNAAEAV